MAVVSAVPPLNLLHEMSSKSAMVTSFQVQVNLGDMLDETTSWTAEFEQRNTFVHIPQSPPAATPLVRSKTAPAAPLWSPAQVGSLEACEWVDYPTVSTEERGPAVGLRLLTVATMDHCELLPEDLEIPTILCKRSGILHSEDSEVSTTASCTPTCEHDNVALAEISEKPSVLESGSSEETASLTAERLLGPIYERTEDKLNRKSKAYVLDGEAQQKINGIPYTDAAKILEDIVAKSKGRDRVRRPSRYVIVACNNVLAVQAASSQATTTASGLADVVADADSRSPPSAELVGQVPEPIVGTQVETGQTAATAFNDVVAAAPEVAIAEPFFERRKGLHRTCSGLAIGIEHMAEEVGCIVM